MKFNADAFKRNPQLKKMFKFLKGEIFDLEWTFHGNGKLIKTFKNENTNRVLKNLNLYGGEIK